MLSLWEKFYGIQPFYGTILAIDGTHIPIEAPRQNPARYINRKGFHSISFQTTVDADYIIRDVYGGFPGCCHDAYLLNNSRILTWINESIPNGFFVIGDAAYPAGNHLVTPYKGNLTPEMEASNFKLSSQRMRVECTLGRLKGRFKRLMSSSKTGLTDPLLTCSYLPVLSIT